MFVFLGVTIRAELSILMLNHGAVEDDEHHLDHKRNNLNIGGWTVYSSRSRRYSRYLWAVRRDDRGHDARSKMARIVSAFLPKAWDAGTGCV